MKLICGSGFWVVFVDEPGSGSSSDKFECWFKSEMRRVAKQKISEMVFLQFRIMYWLWKTLLFSMLFSKEFFSQLRRLFNFYFWAVFSFFSELRNKMEVHFFGLHDEIKIIQQFELHTEVVFSDGIFPVQLEFGVIVDRGGI